MYEQILDDDFTEFIQYVLDNHVGIMPRRCLRDRENPIERYSDVEFIRRYHFSKETVTNIIMPLVVSTNLTGRGLPVPPILKVLTCLRFYASGSFQVVCGDLNKISQASVSRIIKSISVEIADKLSDWVKMPKTNQEYRNCSRRFHALGKFPDVVGCIGCTHIPIINPGGEISEEFRNRKGWFSMNIQVVVGPNMEITNIVTKWQGSIPDAIIFQRSQLKQLLDREVVKGILVGDRGFPQLPYLYTPLANPTTVPERLYNAAHTATSCIVERTLRIWKRRFPCLSMKLRTKLPTTMKIIMACAVLHNIAIQQGDELSDSVPEMLDVNVPVVAVQSQNRRGIAERSAFIQRHFGQGL